jgi:hypothetical protein
MKFDQDFKDALAQLPNKEKDKLILRLLKKDINLANQLYFELLDTRSVEELRNSVKQKIQESLKYRSNHFYSPGVLMMYLRDISGVISEHVSTTKDKFGEPYLNCVMLIHALHINSANLNQCSIGESFKFNTYVVARIFRILTQVKALHEDLQLDFQEVFEQLVSEMIEIQTLMDATIYHGLDMNWIDYQGIPENIAFIQKELRSRGYLK